MLAEMSGDVERGCGTGAALQQVPVPLGLAGRPYGEVATHLMLSQRLLCLGLYRRKIENPGELCVGGEGVAEGLRGRKALVWGAA